MCERLCDHLSKSQHTRRQILGGRRQSSSFRNPCLQRACAQRSASFSHHSLWVSCSTTSLLVGFCLISTPSPPPPFFSSTKCIVSFGSWFYQENGIRIVWDFVSHYQKYCSGWISPFKAAALSVFGVVRCRENRVAPVIVFFCMHLWGDTSGSLPKPKVNQTQVLSPRF